MTRYTMVIDLKRCVGCHTCAIACKMANNLPKDILWNRILTIGNKGVDTAIGSYPNNKMSFLPVNCQHCSDPACVKVCPTGATYQREDGIVMQDVDKCIGCRLCMNACPYEGVRQFNDKEPEYYIDIPVGDASAQKHKAKTVSKCIFCAPRLAEGKQPACIELCVGRARYFGDLDDPESELHQLLRERESVKLTEEAGTNPNIFYLI